MGQELPDFIFLTCKGLYGADTGKVFFGNGI